MFTKKNKCALKCKRTCVRVSVSALATFTKHLYLPPAATSLHVTPQCWSAFLLCFCQPVLWQLWLLNLNSLPLYVISPSPFIHFPWPRLTKFPLIQHPSSLPLFLRGEVEFGRVRVGGHTCHHRSFETLLPRASWAPGAIRLLHRHCGDSQWVTSFNPRLFILYVSISCRNLIGQGWAINFPKGLHEWETDRCWGPHQ